MKNRKPIEGHQEWDRYDNGEDCCPEHAVRELEAYTTSLEKQIEETKHETVEQWESRTGEIYPDDAPVWVVDSDSTELKLYKDYWTDIVELIKYQSDNTVIIANHHGKPSVDTKEDEG